LFSLERFNLLQDLMNNEDSFVDERNRYKNIKKTPNVDESLQPNSTTFDSQQAFDTEYKIFTRDSVSVAFMC